MKELDEKTALAIVFANTKRKKRTADLLCIAQAFDYLFNLYGSQKALSKKVGLSTEIIREFRKILTLAPEVQDMIKSKRIDRLDVAYRISKIDDPQTQIEVAEQAAQLQSKDVRNIERLISSTSLSVKDSQKAVLESKLKDLHVFVVDFSEDDYRDILKRASNAKIPPAELIKQVVLNWLNKIEGIRPARK